jgi:hypothetical protein
MPPVLYDQAQITDWLGAPTVAKAQRYLNAVSQLSWTDDTLSGKVQGTERRPYRVNVQFEQLDDDLLVDGECSCPVGCDCKHVAALLLAGLEQLPKAPAGVRTELVQWLEGFQARHSTSPRQSSKPKATLGLAYVIGASHSGLPQVTLYKARLRVDGTIRALEDTWDNVEAALVKPTKFIVEEDLPLLRGLLFNRSRDYYRGFMLHGAAGGELLAKLIATGRTFAGSATGVATDPQALRQGASRRGVLDWQSQASQRLRCVLTTEDSHTIIRNRDG